MTGRHYDLDVLADLAEGLLDDETTKAVRGHLARCQRCAADNADLGEVTRLLAEAPPPVLPASLAARLDAALLAEATRGAPVVDLASRRRARIVRFATVAAAAVVVSGGGLFALTNGSLTAADQSGPLTITPPAAEGPSYPVAASGTDYTEAALRTFTAPQRRAEDAVALTAAQAACVASLVSAGRVSFVDVARYEGVEALIVVVGSGGDGVTIHVAGAGCAPLAEIRR
ncbi:hypothetical protein LO762_25040 [Actinocorallia sp. API 0066]|uniref:hypothetical protein n=1 Tax=Actinocorallia sp. API 0066 TaxID=2896846 RepID=UPI001E46DA43|nr:hypothetical protein [Actinocorallia sp. API 0066]MCD0452428.1 hypothetical protein [Actinocorallia sp. API 0066]